MQIQFNPFFSTVFDSWSQYDFVIYLSRYDSEAQRTNKVRVLQGPKDHSLSSWPLRGSAHVLFTCIDV